MDLLQTASPAYTELEVVMMDWLCKALDLPEQFLSGGKGGGVIQVKKYMPAQKVFVSLVYEKVDFDS